MKNKLFIKAFIILNILTFTVSSCKKEEKEEKQTIKAVNRTTCTYDIFLYEAGPVSGDGVFLGSVEPGQTKSFEISVVESIRSAIQARPCSSCTNCSNGNFDNVSIDGFFHYGETYSILIDN